MNGTGSAERLAYGFVRRDRSGESTDDHVDQIRALASRLPLQLRGVLVSGTDAEFARLLASFVPSGIAILLVPHVVHLAGWMDATRRDVDIWSLNPLGRWPRLVSAHHEVFVPGADGGW
ncbi:hypothetical protein ACIP5Y_12730 [Nocardia sp. NPDC088792]|uniref:hypothetical protein n=1 Tax=Nocardia sp. NPDC088792 TaxID=3364332 RepID=UPI003806DC0A